MINGILFPVFPLAWDYKRNNTMGGRPGARAVRNAPFKVSSVLPPEILKALRHTAVMVTLVFLLSRCCKGKWWDLSTSRHFISHGCIFKIMTRARPKSHWKAGWWTLPTTCWRKSWFQITQGVCVGSVTAPPLGRHCIPQVLGRPGEELHQVKESCSYPVWPQPRILLPVLKYLVLFVLKVFPS